eukprot:scaffold42743_cov68-Phaeocystis_antarctica.AAC.1
MCRSGRPGRGCMAVGHALGADVFARSPPGSVCDVGTVARRKKLAPPMEWVTRLGAKRPANVARFRGLTASQRYRSKRSRCATPPKS